MMTILFSLVSVYTPPPQPRRHEPLWYCNPCLGLPPFALEGPPSYFGLQLLSALASLLLLDVAGGRA
jgi:hypothetical protein